MCVESEENRRLFFHMSEVRGNPSDLQPGDAVEFVMLTNQRNGKCSACNVVKIRQVIWLLFTNLTTNHLIFRSDPMSRDVKMTIKTCYRAASFVTNNKMKCTSYAKICINLLVFSRIQWFKKVYFQLNNIEFKYSYVL